MGYIFWLNMPGGDIWSIIAGITVMNEGCRTVCQCDWWLLLSQVRGKKLRAWETSRWALATAYLIRTPPCWIRYRTVPCGRQRLNRYLPNIDRVNKVVQDRDNISHINSLGKHHYIVNHW